MPEREDAERITDGRRRKGERRRRELLEAVLRVIVRDGIAAVTQRAVAKEAGVPPSAVLYYFATVDELLVAALARVNGDYIERVRALPEEPGAALRGLAGLIAEAADAERASALAEYELYLMAARRPALRAELHRWNGCLDALALRCAGPDPAARAAFTAAVDGLMMRAFVEEGPADPERVHAALSRLAPGAAGGPAR
ncbi:TetR/AcrR family transcriptional regulator [Nocardiopsis potens]|uniref:TetR/AcrR family transcriptional regulator n=1 Tax=Nocardiopsis potens TaxID=1246458 RepID=UPI00034B973D|nr:TetR family transcriptional regulator [Nocardiopsis potens]